MSPLAKAYGCAGGEALVVEYLPIKCKLQCVQIPIPQKKKKKGYD
jgi:hypothetical protein